MVVAYQMTEERGDWGWMFVLLVSIGVVVYLLNRPYTTQPVKPTTQPLKPSQTQGVPSDKTVVKAEDSESSSLFWPLISLVGLIVAVFLFRFMRNREALPESEDPYENASAPSLGLLLSKEQRWQAEKRRVQSGIPLWRRFIRGGDYSRYINALNNERSTYFHQGNFIPIPPLSTKANFDEIIRHFKQVQPLTRDERDRYGL